MHLKKKVSVPGNKILLHFFSGLIAWKLAQTPLSLLLATSGFVTAFVTNM
jgi:hypothetical protein